MTKISTLFTANYVNILIVFRDDIWKFINKISSCENMLIKLNVYRFITHTLNEKSLCGHSSMPNLQMLQSPYRILHRVLHQHRIVANQVEPL